MMTQDASADPALERRAAALLDQMAVVILNHNGRAHLGPCLEALLAADGLAGPEAIVVADNGSRDGSLDWLADRHPRLRRIAFRSNLGFAAGNNAAAERVDAPWLLFLNNDTRVRPDAPRQLALAAAGGADAVGARLLSWDGSRLDFDGGAASFTGHGHALGYGRPVPAGPPPPPQPSLFCSGAALLVRRETFLALGGFAPDYFAYYEDLDLGWRMQLAGLTLRQVPAARVEHRHHGSAGQLPSGRAARLYERNALATVLRNYDAPNLARVLPAALALAACRAGAADRAAAQGLIDAAASGIEDGPGGLPLPRADWRGWPMLADLALDFAALARGREAVQALRARSDAEILPLLGRPYAAVPASRAAEAALRRAVARFELEPIFGPLPDADRPAQGPREAGRLARRAAGALRQGGARWLVEEVRGYLRWRRGSHG